MSHKREVRHHLQKDAATWDMLARHAREEAESDRALLKRL